MRGRDQPPGAGLHPGGGRLPQAGARRGAAARRWPRAQSPCRCCRFRVYAWDSTTIALPDALAAAAGCGGRVATNTQAALKVQARWDLTTGALDLVRARAGERRGGAAARPAGALLLCDLGYVSMGRLRTLARRAC
ncbi:MAG: hypothetical protein U0841_19490 [Chloroflexia bacterium]